MHLVGILTEKNNEGYIKQELHKLGENEIFFLNEDSITNLKNIKFQTILIGKKVKENSKEVHEILSKAEYLIFNVDITENLELINNLNLQLITYGFNSKASITASSMEGEEVMVCLQRSIKSVNGKITEPQEITIKAYNNVSKYGVMELLGINLVYA